LVTFCPTSTDLCSTDRTVHEGLQDLLPIVNNVTHEQAEKIDIKPYAAADFTEDIMRLGEYRSDPEMVKAVVNGSREAIQWLYRIGVPFALSFNRQAYEVDGRQVFWGGMALSVENGGKGLMEAHGSVLKRAGVEVWLESPARELIVHDDRVQGVVVQRGGELMELHAPTVVLACGGFESSSHLRAVHLGSDWARAKVRCSLSGLRPGSL
jgi:succinate dehydrogenase/fumarate reductase flavoprotein subunit